MFHKRIVKSRQIKIMYTSAYTILIPMMVQKLVATTPTSKLYFSFSCCARRQQPGLFLKSKAMDHYVCMKHT
jgi:hypothetical protein